MSLKSVTSAKCGVNSATNNARWWANPLRMKRTPASTMMVPSASRSGPLTATVSPNLVKQPKRSKLIRGCLLYLVVFAPSSQRHLLLIKKKIMMIMCIQKKRKEKKRKEKKRKKELVCVCVTLRDKKRKMCEARRSSYLLASEAVVIEANSSNLYSCRRRFSCFNVFLTHHHIRNLAKNKVY